MRKQKITLLVCSFMSLVVMIAACGSKNGSSASNPSTPTEVMQTFYASLQKKDVAALKQSMSKELLEKIGKVAKEGNQTVDEWLSNNIDSIRSSMTSETRNEKIEGDRATLEFKNSQGDWRPQHFVKEDGVWKMSW